MSTQIQFRSGQLQKFIATRSFALGNTGVTIQAGGEIDFDGTMMSYEGSSRTPMPSLRGAVKTGWLVLAAAYDPTDLSSSIPQPAGVQVRAANGGNPMDPQSRSMVTTVDAEEREVGNVQAHARSTQQRNTNYRPGQRSASNVTVEAQEGVHVRSLSTPAKQTTNFEHESPAEAIRRADSARIQAGVGRTREEMLAHMSAEDRAEYLAKLESKKLSHVDEPVIVGRVAAVKNQQREGFQINNEVGGGIEIADAGGTGGDVVESTTTVEGLTFRNTNVGKPKPKEPSSVVASSDVRRRIARSICPDFPDNYVFDDPVRKKIARLQADFDDRPDIIKAAAAAESDDETKVRLVEEFPGAFA